MAEHYSSIVIGAGIEGSWTAYHLANTTGRVLLLEQFPLPHTRGSSHGQSRIIRKAYVEQHYAQMMHEAYTQWFQLEKDAGVSLYRKSGLLCVGKSGSSALPEIEDSLRQVNSSYTKLTSSDLKRDYPIMDFPGFDGILDHSAGVLRADKCLMAVQDAYKKAGGVIRDGEMVTDISPGSPVKITTNKGTYTADNLVITAGPWTAKLTKPLGVHLPLKPVRISVLYWSGRHGVSLDQLPLFIDCRDETSDTYALPALEYPGLYKLCLHTGPEIDPDQRDMGEETWDIERMKKYVSQHFPGLEPQPSIVEKCIYTNTPDHGFILDTHPRWSNIVIGAGFSGHGFKLAPVVGKLLMELALKKRTSYNMGPFKIDRFGETTKAKL